MSTVERIMWNLVDDANNAMLAARNKAADLEARYPDDSKELDYLNAEADMAQAAWVALIRAYKDCFGQDWAPEDYREHYYAGIEANDE